MPDEGGQFLAVSCARAIPPGAATLARWQESRAQTWSGLSNDPFFIEKVRGIVGLYLNPPDHTLVLCVDEKSQCQALDVADSTVLTRCKPKRRHQKVLAFLRHIEANVPEQLDVHLIRDNYGTHRHARVKTWLARRPRFHLHFTPTYSSWLNQVERWFALITTQAIRRGSFDSVADLKRKIEEFVKHYNQHLNPFMWNAMAASTLAKIERLCKVINGTPHQHQAA
jgi:transposase